MTKLYSYLTYAGALPFVGCALLLLVNVTSLPLLGETWHVLQVYALVIAAFMAGSHWGQHLTLPAPWSVRLPVFSNLIAIGLWLGYLLLPIKPWLALSIAAFLLLLWLDHALCQQQKITADYFQTRLTVTAIVVVALLLALLASPAA
ncbi:MAG: DUF3429 domain-containing protein [Methylococcales bacterium]|nr:DUF3429 domain-containing protein [Methylococcales bacterium]